MTGSTSSTPRASGTPSRWGTVPRLSTAWSDSPVAVARGSSTTTPTAMTTSPARSPANAVGNLTRDEVLDNITLTWVTNTGISSGRLYYENSLDFFDAKGVTVPAAVSVFPRELYQAPRSWAEQAYPELVYFNEVDRGGHFVAWQEPELFVQEVRAGFRPMRPLR